MNNPNLSDRESKPILAVLYQIDLHGCIHLLLSPRLLVNDDRKYSNLSDFWVDKSRRSWHQRFLLAVIHGGVQSTIDKV